MPKIAGEGEDAEPIPTSIGEAIEAARGSQFMKDVLGEHMFELYLQQSEREVGFFDDQVTQVEVDRYIRNF